MPNANLNTPPQLVNALRQYGVTVPNNVEAHAQTFYDYQNYVPGGKLAFQFFQNTPGSNNYTGARTNMPSAGQFPNPQNFLWMGTYIKFIPGSSTTEFVPAGVVGAPGATVSGKTPMDDVAAVMLSPAVYTFQINTKTYLTAAPLASLPAPWKLRADIAASFQLATAAANQMAAGVAFVEGDVVRSSGQIITSNMQISGNIVFDSLAALPSGNIGLIGVVLAGIWYQGAQ